MNHNGESDDWPYWMSLADDEEQLVRLTDLPRSGVLDPADPDDRRHQIILMTRVALTILDGHPAEAEQMLNRLPGGLRASPLRRLAEIWLDAEAGQLESAIERLTRWMRLINSPASHRWTSRRRWGASRRQTLRALSRKVFRMAQRWAPVLRLYLISRLDAWDPVSATRAEADLKAIEINHIPEYVRWRLLMQLRLTEARISRDVDSAVAVSLEWEKLCAVDRSLGSGSEFLLESVRALEYADRLDEALALIDRMLPRSTRPHPLLIARGHLLKDLGRLDEARSIVSALLSRNARDANAHCLRSHICFLAGELPDALDAAEEALAIAPEDTSNRLARAFVRLQIGAYREALEDFDHILAVDPLHEDAMRGKSKCHAMLGEDSAALALLNQLRRQYPDEPELLYEIADVYLAAGYYNEAEQACRRCLQLDDQSTGALVLLAIIATRREEDDLARGLLERALAIEPKNAFALNEMACLYDLEGDDEMALELVLQALAASPNYAEAYCNLGMLRYYRSEFEAAEAAFARVLELIPDHVTAWLGRGNALTQLSDLENAQRCYDRALQLDPGSADACQGKAVIYRLMGLDDEVRIWQEKAHALDPEIEAP